MFDLGVWVVLLCTAYTNSVADCGKIDGITASGTRAVAGRTVAADHLPFGTELIIDNQRYVVEDRFGAGHKNRLDIFMDTKEEAINFGVRYKVARIVKKEKDIARATINLKNYWRTSWSRPSEICSYWQAHYSL